MLILIVIIMLITTFSMGVFLTEKSGKAIRKLIDDYMLSVSKAAAGMIDGDELAGLDKDSKGSPEYEHVRDTLSRSGITCTIRASRGEDILAACGMLAGQKK